MFPEIWATLFATGVRLQKKYQYLGLPLIFFWDPIFRKPIISHHYFTIMSCRLNPITILYYIIVCIYIYIQYILIPIPIKSQIPRICSQDMLGWSKLLNYSDFQSIPLSQGRTLQFQHERRAFGHFGTMQSGSMEMDISYTSLVMIILGQIK